jgi:NADH-quinone oxidoreductase subunit L
MYISVAAGLGGIALAYLFYVVKPGLAGAVTQRLGGLYRLVYNKYFVDEIYDAAIVQPLIRVSSDILWRDVDAGLIDGTVNGVGSRARGVGEVLRLFQSGSIRSYAAWVLWGSVVALFVCVFLGGGR